MVFEEVQDSIWLFKFAKKEDKERVLEGRPWSFDRQILVLNEFDGNESTILDGVQSLSILDSGARYAIALYEHSGDLMYETCFH